MTVELTPEGKTAITQFLKELEETRKDRLDAKYDTADQTSVPTLEEIIEDIGDEENIDDDGNYHGTWGCTDNTELTLHLEVFKDFVSYPALNM